MENKFVVVNQGMNISLFYYIVDYYLFLVARPIHNVMYVQFNKSQCFWNFWYWQRSETSNFHRKKHEKRILFHGFALLKCNFNMLTCFKGIYAFIAWEYSNMVREMYKVYTCSDMMAVKKGYQQDCKEKIKELSQSNLSLQGIDQSRQV